MGICIRLTPPSTERIGSEEFQDYVVHHPTIALYLDADGRVVVPVWDSRLKEYRAFCVVQRPADEQNHIGCHGVNWPLRVAPADSQVIITQPATE